MLALFAACAEDEPLAVQTRRPPVTALAATDVTGTTVPPPTSRPLPSAGRW